LDDKKTLRYKIQSDRDRIPLSQRLKKTKIIAAKLVKLPEYRDSETLLIYHPFRSEPDTTIIIKKAQNQGKQIILPRVCGKKLELFFIENLKTQLEKGSYGIMEPVKSLCKPADICDIDLAIIPGVCFDKELNRIGYGGGFYDRLLPMLDSDVKKIALCFEMQVVDKICASENDIKVDKIITESSTYK